MWKINKDNQTAEIKMGRLTLRIFPVKNAGSTTVSLWWSVKWIAKQQGKFPLGTTLEKAIEWCSKKWGIEKD